MFDSGMGLIVRMNRGSGHEPGSRLRSIDWLQVVWPKKKSGRRDSPRRAKTVKCLLSRDHEEGSQPRPFPLHLFAGSGQSNNTRNSMIPSRVTRYILRHPSIELEQ